MQKLIDEAYVICTAVYVVRDGVRVGFGPFVNTRLIVT